MIQHEIFLYPYFLYQMGFIKQKTQFQATVPLMVYVMSSLGE
jgi:hypothetical protein